LIGFPQLTTAALRKWRFFLPNEAFVYIWKFVVARELFVKIRHLRKCRGPLEAIKPLKPETDCNN